MWSVDGKTNVRLLEVMNNWKKIQSLGVRCFTFYFGDLTEHQIYQIAWYLEANHISYDDIGGVINFINYLGHKDIIITKMEFRWLKLEKPKVMFTVNFSVFRHWYIPLKFKYFFIRRNIRRRLCDANG